MQAINAITEKLESAGIRYCIVGGLASIAYGRPRLTLDADLLVALTTTHATKFAEIFPAEEFYTPPPEILIAEIQRDSRGHFNIIHQRSALRADCYLPGKNPLAHWELSNRKKLSSPSGDGWFAPPESIIVNKLLFYKEGGSQKHLEDILAMIQSGSVKNFPELKRWITELGLQKEWAPIESDQERQL
jgi:hypothetical protein